MRGGGGGGVPGPKRRTGGNIEGLAEKLPVLHGPFIRV